MDHTTGDVSNRTQVLAFLPCSGNPFQPLTIQSFSKSYEILHGNDPPQEEAKYHIVTWHKGASHSAAVWPIPCRCAACGGTQEEELALLEVLVAG